MLNTPAVCVSIFNTAMSASSLRKSEFRIERTSFDIGLYFLAKEGRFFRVVFPDADRHGVRGHFSLALSFDELHYLLAPALTLEGRLSQAAAFL